MLRFFFILVSVITGTYNTAAHRFLETSTSPAYESLWNYDDESTWPGELCQKGGTRQSPINIQKSDVITDYKYHFIKYGPLQLVGYRKVLVSGINNGHTIQFSTEGDEAIHPTVTGGPLNYTYRLEQLHFHWLSEHSIDGHKYPLELHFVHVRSDLSVFEALNEKDGLAIIATFCNVKGNLMEHQQKTTEEVVQHVPNLVKVGDRVSGLLVDMTKLLSSNLNSYFTYAGSLTSPECNEAVIWIIFDTPLQMSDSQYRLFTKAGPRHNFRSLRRLSHHLVFRPPTSFVQTPHIVKIVDDTIKLVKDFFKNISSFIAKGFKSR